MRVVPPELQARLDSGATRLCRCWGVERRDGVVFGFTDHDRDIAFGGVVFRASSGMDASALQSATGLSVDNAQTVGALTSAGSSDRSMVISSCSTVTVTLQGNEPGLSPSSSRMASAQ